MKIFTIIVTYNAAKWIEPCISALRNSTIQSQIVIVDNASTDITLSYLKHQNDIILFPQSQNIGFGQANNIGIKYALENGADYILLLNQDAYVAPNMIEQLVKHSDFIHLQTPIHLNGNGSKVDEMFSYTLYKAGLTNDVSSLTSSTYWVGETAAACWFIPVSLIHVIGGFNPLFFQYGEDNNYYNRMRYHRLNNVMLVPQARVCHDRTLHGNLQIYKQGLLHRQVLLAVTDINLTATDRAISLLRIIYYCYNGIRRNHYKIGGLLQEMFWTIEHYNDIKHSRSIERQNGAWL